MRLVSYWLLINLLSCHEAGNQSIKQFAVDQDSASRIDTLNNVAHKNIVRVGHDTLYLKNTGPERNIFNFSEGSSVIELGTYTLELVKLGDFYHIKLREGDKQIFKSEKIRGVSPVWYDGEVIATSFLDFVNDDGACTGYPFIFRLKDRSIKIGIHSLQNISNPIVSGDNIIIIEELSVIFLDSSFNEIYRRDLIYNGNYDLDYIDTYKICFLSGQDGKLNVGFKPNKTQGDCEHFGGSLTDSDGSILLMRD